jgi:antitoxin component YwqK of YwqJK toxin-antitoxin module
MKTFLAFALLCGLALRLASSDGVDAGSGHVVTAYYADGNAKTSTTYVEGKRHGPYREWYQDGSLEVEGSFDRGQREGDWRYYARDGRTDAERSGRFHEGLRVAPLDSAHP